MGWEGEEGERGELLWPMACLAPLPPHPDPLLLKEERRSEPHLRLRIFKLTHDLQIYLFRVARDWE